MNCTSVTPQRIVVCRLCTKSHEYYVNIFISNESCEIIVEEAIQDVLGLPVAVGDGLPNHVCRLCVRKLIELREFKNMCFKSATELRAYALGNDFLVSKIKDEDAADIETSREGSIQENTFLNDMQVSEVYVTTPDEPSIGNVSHANEELWSSENALVVKEEINGEEHHIEVNVPMNALTSFAEDPLAVDTMALKEEAQEPKVSAGEGNSLSDRSPHNHIRVTEVFVPFPDELAMGIVRYAEEDSRPTELIVKEEIGAGLECSENNVPVVSLSSVDVDPLAVDTTVYRCNNIGGLTEEPEKQSDKFRADRQGISENKVLNNPSRDIVGEENLQLEYSMANSYVLDCFPEGRVKKHNKNVNLYASSKKISQSNDTASTVGNQECNQLCHQAENASYPTDYVCNYCSTRYSVKKLLALHIKTHTDGKKTESVLPKKNFPPRFTQRLLLKGRGNVESVISETSNISLTHNNSRCKNEKSAVEQYSGGDNFGRELYNSGTLLFNSIEPQERVAYVCDTCGIACLKKSDLVKHVNVHTGLNPCRYQQKCVVTHTNFKPLKCDLCGKNFKNTKALKRHSVVHTGVKPFKCNECGKVFTQKGHLKVHSLVHLGVKRFKCDECGMMFTTSSHLKSHSVVHTGLKPFKCDECGKKFTRKSDFKRHLVIHTGVKRFKCNECGKMFAQKGHLKDHSFVHLGVKRFKCDECGKKFTGKGVLNRHLVIHTGVKRFKCKECGKMFTQKSDLNTHSVVHTGVKRFKCNECGKMFSTSSHLNMHSVVHTGVTPFKCNECGKMFARKSYLKRHLVIHTGLNRFKCNECGKMFTQKSHLITHSVVHTGVKSIKCDECGMLFNRSSHLNRHSVVHTGIKSFQCNECGKMFTQKGNLIKHSVVHTHVKRFKCDECGKMFTTGSDLKRHSRFHSGVMPFKCDVCGKQFKWRSSFCSHLHTHVDRNPSN